MPRPCGPCSDPNRNELDRRLLNMAVSHESYRTISDETNYSESALKRHKTNHITVDLSEVKLAMDKAREEALQEVQAQELETIKAAAADTTAARMATCVSFIDQLKEVRNHAANLLDLAEGSEDLRAAGTFLRELREQIRLWAELEGKIASQPQVNILLDPQWIELRTTILTVLDDFPEAKLRLVDAIRGR
jgi:hypothetical protein